MAEDQKEGSGFDRLVADLQRQVDEQAQAIYSARLIEEAHHPSHVGRMDAPDAYGRSLGWCGDMMEFYLRLNGERIEAVKFVMDGCGPTLACGNALARPVEGLTLEEAGDVAPQQIAEALDSLPEGHFHCAELAVSTLQNAILGWRFKQQEGSGESG